MTTRTTIVLFTTGMLLAAACPARADLVALWRFDADVDPQPDATANANDAALAGDLVGTIRYMSTVQAASRRQTPAGSAQHIGYRWSAQAWAAASQRVEAHQHAEKFGQPKRTAQRSAQRRHGRERGTQCPKSCGLRACADRVVCA